MTSGSFFRPVNESSNHLIMAALTARDPIRLRFIPRCRSPRGTRVQHGFDPTDLTEQLGRARIERGREPRLRPREDRMEDEEGTGRDRRASPGTPLLKTESHASSFASTV